MGAGPLVVLADSALGPCDCLVLHAATGRVATALARATRQWDDAEWSAATARLARRGRLGSEALVADAGRAARERVEQDPDEHCAATGTAPRNTAGWRRRRRLATPTPPPRSWSGTSP
ncbi:helix-turn-helix domain-containing protein [Streptomyces reniochalinae]|uniref:helix-turn-helix domain-containing protein n=1 Tax=Streptomyces reniochalinae TaxID=2250578 RepID=UPI003CCC4A64